MIVKQLWIWNLHKKYIITLKDVFFDPWSDHRASFLISEKCIVEHWHGAWLFRTGVTHLIILTEIHAFLKQQVLVCGEVYFGWAFLTPDNKFPFFQSHQHVTSLLLFSCRQKKITATHNSSILLVGLLDLKISCESNLVLKMLIHLEIKWLFLILTIIVLYLQLELESVLI